MNTPETVWMKNYNTGEVKEFPADNPQDIGRLHVAGWSQCDKPTTAAHAE